MTHSTVRKEAAELIGTDKNDLGYEKSPESSCVTYYVNSISKKVNSLALSVPGREAHFDPSERRGDRRRGWGVVRVKGKKKNSKKHSQTFEFVGKYTEIFGMAGEGMVISMVDTIRNVSVFLLRPSYAHVCRPHIVQQYLEYLHS